MSETMRAGRKTLVSAVILATVMWSMMASILVAPLTASAAGCVSGTLIKGSLPAVYYCGADGKRYVFTNDKNYFTWYSSFSNIQILSDSDLGNIMIGGNVTYRPGVKMVKIQSDPKTYAIAHGGSLRWVQSEALATCLYGSTWNQQIDDISDAFFVNYQVGFAITSCADYNRIGEMQNSETINEDKELTPEQPNPPPSSPTVISVSPLNASTNVSVGTNVTATFSEAMNAATLNAGTFLLAKGTIAVAGTVTYAGNTATFNPSANLDANAVYTATITTGARDLEGNALSGGNYSWSFTTGPSPAVISTTPADGASNVSVSTTVTATFNEAMNASTLNTGTFLLAKGATSVSGTVTYSGNTATFFPNASLDANAVYTATITTGARDLDGNALAGGNFSWSFTTGPSPIVISTSPVNGGANVNLNANVTATFSESMNASTLNASTFTLVTGSATVAGTVTYAGDTATFNPDANLASNTTYTATITAGARDVDGNALFGGNHSWSFTTVP